MSAIRSTLPSSSDWVHSVAQFDENGRPIPIGCRNGDPLSLPLPFIPNELKLTESWLALWNELCHNTKKEKNGKEENKEPAKEKK